MPGSTWLRILITRRGCRSHMAATVRRKSWGVMATLGLYVSIYGGVRAHGDGAVAARGYGGGISGEGLDTPQEARAGEGDGQVRSGAGRWSTSGPEVNPRGWRSRLGASIS
jgi:hypothetical protein